ncbi:M14 family metallopeptidase [Paenibacillus guangzhouensis]|uniref:M14 family metallopeptidase n=1 Tax=Paenibacillus guangzhouensis TaxID=1473112 RepID=UPI0012670AB2|nr:M14 family metallocarboxypeptidase [Paenibacillus guangzhouensis]
MKKFLSLLLVVLILIGSTTGAAHATSSNIVQYSNLYTYDMMARQLQQLQKAYPDAIHLESIGKTAYQRDIWAVRVGQGTKSIFINGSHHAREWITSILNMKMIETYAQSYTNTTKYNGYHTKELLDHVSIWFVPMVNPDGVTLQQFGSSAFPQQDRAQLIQMNDGSLNFTRWKANAQGIDLNRQYDADWSNIKNNSGRPYWWNYKGPKPVYANETKAMVEFTYRIQPEIAVSYHSSGEILFWNFHTDPANLERDKRLASTYSQLTGYSLVKPSPNPSGGGYTDWFISTFKKPGFTPEVGNAVNNQHVPVKHFGGIWNQNNKAGVWLAEEAYKLTYSQFNTSNTVEVWDEVLLLQDAKVFYDIPSILKPAKGTIKQASVRTLAKKGDWYQINTWLGKQWIYEANATFEQSVLQQKPEPEKPSEEPSVETTEPTSSEGNAETEMHEPHKPELQFTVE